MIEQWSRICHWNKRLAECSISRCTLGVTTAMTNENTPFCQPLLFQDAQKVYSRPKRADTPTAGIDDYQPIGN
jgi:hypothetical protein